MEIKFCGAAETVTGSKHLITLKNGKKILLDCGMFQGRGKESYEMNQTFHFDPNDIDCMILSHAHIDHSGNIPRLVKQGFKGKIYCTPATRDLAEIMLFDSAFIQENEASNFNKYRLKEGEKPIKPLYTIEDAEKSFLHLHTVPYDTHFKIFDGLELLFTDSGHILGSAAVNLTITEEGKTQHLCFTGDIGRYVNRLLKQPAVFPQADTIICESTYGDRLHESAEDTKEKLMQVVHETCVINKGKLIIPAFSIGKTQELIYVLNQLEFAGKLPPIKVYVDSPLAINATDIMRNHPESFSNEVNEYIKKDPSPFGFNGLEYVRKVEDSKAINLSKEPCIIISASGMAEAGRVKHHLANNIENPRNAVLIIGYCEPSSNGGKLASGEKSISIFGKKFDVKAKVHVIDFFSAHGDYNEMLQYLSCQNPKKVKHFFLVHGNREVMLSFKEKLQEKGFDNIIIPQFLSTHSC
jgi:metallo-beta-lactamase family protein